MKKYELASKLPKNLTSQEWFSLKQKVLDHKDFPKFQTVYFNEITEHNQKINKKLEDPKMEKELDFLIKKYSISERIRQFTNQLPPYSKYKALFSLIIFSSSSEYFIRKGSLTPLI